MPLHKRGPLAEAECLTGSPPLPPAPSGQVSSGGAAASASALLQFKHAANQGWVLPWSALGGGHRAAPGRAAPGSLSPPTTGKPGRLPISSKDVRYAGGMVAKKRSPREDTSGGELARSNCMEQSQKVLCQENVRRLQSSRHTKAVSSTPKAGTRRGYSLGYSYHSYHSYPSLCPPSHCPPAHLDGVHDLLPLQI